MEIIRRVTPALLSGDLGTQSLSKLLYKYFSNLDIVSAEAAFLKMPVSPSLGH